MGRTGTASLKFGLERLLGAPCYHMMEVFPRPHHFGLWTAAARGERIDWHALFDGFVAAVDWPAAAFWRELSEVYPDAVIVHSERDAASWWKSATATIFDVSRGKLEGPMSTMIEALFSTRFTPRIDNREECIATYERLNAEVLATAPRDRLVQWKASDGWGPLCAALKLPVPAEPFPHANTTEEFRARVASGDFPGKH
jgi:hypothetical protein